MLQKSRIQKVQLFENDCTKVVEQSVLIDLKENWISVTHGDSEMSMSMKNWSELVNLAEATKPEKNQL